MQVPRDIIRIILEYSIEYKYVRNCEDDDDYNYIFHEAFHHPWGIYILEKEIADVDDDLLESMAQY